MRAIFLPGVGVDARLFAPQRALPFRFRVPAWLPIRPGEELPGYADRMAVRLGRADVLVGISFGGILAQELAARVGARLVIGIATARHRRDVPRLVRFSEVVSRKIPQLRRPGAAVELGRAFFGDLPAPTRRRMVAMLAEADPRFVRGAARMVGGWEGCEVPCRALFLHGREDLVIRPRSFEPDVWVEGAGHLVNVTHADRVNRFISRGCTRV